MNACRLAVILLALPAPGQSHATLVRQNIIEVAATSATSTMAVPVAVLHGVDDNGDQRLSPEELHAHRDWVDRQLRMRFRLFNDGKPERIAHQELFLPRLEMEGARGAPCLILIRRSHWSGPVGTMRVYADLFAASGPDSRFRVRASRGQEAESAEMNVLQNEHLFFRSTLAVARDAMAAGIRLLLLEFGDLLVLSAILVAAAGWRRWLRW